MTSAAGEVSATTGRKKPMRNRDIGPPTGRDAARNKAAAELWLVGLLDAEARAERRAGDPLLEELVAMYLDWSEGRNAPRTVQGHAERLKRFVAFRHAGQFYGEKRVRDLKPTDLSRFIRKMTEDGYAHVYTNSIVLSIQAMMNWAARPVEDRVPERILPANPFLGVERPRNPAPPKRYCGEVARRAFLEYAWLRACRQPEGSLSWRFDRLAVALFRFCEATGCRPSEACRLEWEHIDWKGSRAVLSGKTTRKTGRKIVLPLTADVARMLRAIERLEGRHERFVFTHMRRDGKGPADLAGVPWSGNALAHKFRQWRDEAIAAGMPIQAEGAGCLTLYGFRRDMGADVLRKTGSYADVAALLNNSVVTAERHYASFDASHQVNLARAVRERRPAGQGGGAGPDHPLPER